MSSDGGESAQGPLTPGMMNSTEEALIAQGAESLPQATSSIEEAQPEGILSTMLL